MAYTNTYASCSGIVVGNRIMWNDTWYVVTAKTLNLATIGYWDFRLNDPAQTVITWKSSKRVNYQTGSP